MARPRSPFTVEEKPLNVSVPVSLHEDFERFIRTGEGNQRPKKLLVSAAIYALSKMTEAELSALLREYRKAHLTPEGNGGKAAVRTAEVRSRPAEKTPSQGSRRAG